MDWKGVSMNTYVVIDLEMCNAPKPNGAHEGYRGSEIIQIGAVKLNRNYDVIDSYRAYVKPQYTMISTRIQELTGITQEDVDTASDLEESINVFFQWLGEDKITFVSWSDCDEQQFDNEMKKKSLKLPKLEATFGSWIDCQKIFGKKIKRTSKLYNLEQALIISDISYKDGAHDALVDAHNTGLLFKKLNEPGEFKFNQYYCETEDDEHLAYGIGNLLSGMDIDKVVK